MSPRASSYNIIIDAAEDIVIESGASHMSLAAVAAKAGVSKGGLLHHFPSKAALLDAMMVQQVRIHQETWEKILEEIPRGLSRELTAFILATVNRNRARDRLGASLSAAMAHDPRLNEPVRRAVARTYAKFASPSMPFEKAAIIALASGGLWLHEMFNMSPFTEEQRARIIDELLRLADEGAK